MADKWKQIAMGTVVSIASVVGLTSCENKNENQDNNTWTTQSEGSSLTIIRPGFTYDFSTPEDSIREAKEKIEAQKKWKKLWNVEKSAKSDNNEWKIVERSDTFSSVVENDSPEARLEELKQNFKAYHERAAFKDEDLKVEFGYLDASTQDDFDASQEKVSAQQDKPEKKEPPKGSISKDAFINALLEQKRGRGGKKS